MPQLFHRSANYTARMSILAVVILATLGLTAVLGGVRSPNFTNQYLTLDQPIQYSHKHHAGDDGIDCRYCHTGVETSSFAGIPPTKTCMTCHSILFVDSPFLEPVRASYRTGTPIAWNRVHKLDQFAYFDHSIHISKGIGCFTCHGAVDQMPLVRQV